MKKFHIVDFFILIAAFLFIIIFSKTCFECKLFFKLNSTAQAKIISWTIDEKKNKLFAEAEYYFCINDKTFYSKTLFEKFFLNYSSAYKDLSKKNNLTVWYYDKNPQISSLEKNFPIKNLIYSFLSLFALLQFFLIRKNLVSI